MAESMELVGKDEAIVEEQVHKRLKMKQPDETSPASVQKQLVQNTSPVYSKNAIDIQEYGIQKKQFQEIFPDLPIDIVRELEKDTQSLEKLFESKNIVCIIGPIGSGKTILARALFYQINENFDKACVLSIKDLKSNGVKVTRRYILEILGYHDVWRYLSQYRHDLEVRADESHPTSTLSSEVSYEEQEVLPTCQVTVFNRFLRSDEKLLIIIDDVDKYDGTERAELTGILAEIIGMKIDKKVLLTGELYDAVRCYVRGYDNEVHLFKMNGMSYEIQEQRRCRNSMEWGEVEEELEFGELEFEALRLAGLRLEGLELEGLELETQRRLGKLQLGLGKHQLGLGKHQLGLGKRKLTLEEQQLMLMGHQVKLEELQSRLMKLHQRLQENVRWYGGLFRSTEQRWLRPEFTLSGQRRRLRELQRSLEVMGEANLSLKDHVNLQDELRSEEQLRLEDRPEQLMSGDQLRSEDLLRSGNLLKSEDLLRLGELTLKEHLLTLEEGHIRMETLERFPEGFKTYSNTLTIECKNLKCFPPDICLGFYLRKLKLNCRSLRTLPESLFCVPLTDLEVDSEELEALPYDWKELKSSLTKLTLSCRNLRALPESFGDLANLSVLKLKVESLKSLPSSIGSIKNICEFEVKTGTLDFTIKSDQFGDGDVNSRKYIPSIIFDIIREYLSIKNILGILEMGSCDDVGTNESNSNRISVGGRIIPTNCTAQFSFDDKWAMSRLVGVGVGHALVTICKESPNLVTIQEDFQAVCDTANVELKRITLELGHFVAQSYQGWNRSSDILSAINFGIGIESKNSDIREIDAEDDAKPSESLLQTLTRFWILKDVLANPLKNILDYEVSSENMNFPILSMTWLWNLASCERNVCDSRGSRHDSRDQKIPGSSSHGRQNSGGSNAEAGNERHKGKEEAPNNDGASSSQGGGNGGKRPGGGKDIPEQVASGSNSSQDFKDKLTVEVYLKRGGDFIDPDFLDIGRFNTVDSITPTLIFVFTKGKFMTLLNVQFSISDAVKYAEISETNAKFGYSHDNFKVLFGCNIEDIVRLQDIGAANEGVRTETTFTNTSINTRTPTTLSGGVGGGYNGFGGSVKANISTTSTIGPTITKQSQVAGTFTSGCEVNGFRVNGNHQLGQKPTLRYSFDYVRRIIPEKHLDVSNKRVRDSNDELEDDCKNWGVHRFQNFGVGPSNWLPHSLTSKSYLSPKNEPIYIVMYVFKATRTFRKWVKGIGGWEEIKHPQEYERNILINHNIE